MTTQGISVRHVSTISYLLPPANEVWGKVIFLHLFVILFTEGGSSTVHVGIPPLLPRRPPTKETPLPRRPRCQGNPPGQGDPLARRPPQRRACWQIRLTRAVRILLECNLVILECFWFIKVMKARFISGKSIRIKLLSTLVMLCYLCQSKQHKV